MKYSIMFRNFYLLINDLAINRSLGNVSSWLKVMQVVNIIVFFYIYKYEYIGKPGNFNIWFYLNVFLQVSYSFLNIILIKDIVKELNYLSSYSYNVPISAQHVNLDTIRSYYFCIIFDVLVNDISTFYSWLMKWLLNHSKANLWFHTHIIYQAVYIDPILVTR